MGIPFIDSNIKAVSHVKNRNTTLDSIIMSMRFFWTGHLNTRKVFPESVATFLTKGLKISHFITPSLNFDSSKT